MKRTLPNLIALLFILPIAAQNKNELHVQLGYAQACQTPSPAPILISDWDRNIRNGFFGVEYYRNLNSYNAIGVGLQLVEKGFQNHYSFQFTSYLNTYYYFFKLDYLEAPIMYRHTFKETFFHKKLSTTFGVIGSYLVKANAGNRAVQDYGHGLINTYTGGNQNINVFKRYDVNLLVRFSYEFHKNFWFNASFTQGFIKPYIYPSREVMYNEVFMFGISYNFL